MNYSCLLHENIFTNIKIFTLIKTVIIWLLKNKNEPLKKEIILNNGKISFYISSEVKKEWIFFLDFILKPLEVKVFFSKDYLNAVIKNIEENFIYLALQIIRIFSITFAFLNSEKARERYINTLRFYKGWYSTQKDKATPINVQYTEYVMFLERTAWFHFFAAATILTFHFRDEFKKKSLEIIFMVIKYQKELEEIINRGNFKELRRYFRNFNDRYYYYFIPFVIVTLSREKDEKLQHTFLIKILNKIYMNFNKIKKDVLTFSQRIYEDKQIQEVLNEIK